MAIKEVSSIVIKFKNAVTIGAGHMDCVKPFWYLSPMRAAKVQASLRIRAVSPEPPLLAHTSSEIPGPSEWLGMHS